MKNSLEKLTDVLNYVKETFVGKDEIVDLLGICLLARENAFLLGPPGTAKSAIVREFSACIKDGKNFEYLLTRFTEPNEIFGPFDIRKLKDGELVTNTEGMMPEASMVFLDEIFNANSAILNSLLTALNERIFRRGKDTKHLPALMFVGASNQLPEEDSLNALLDRFLVRIQCDYVDPDSLEKVLVAGWSLEKKEKTVSPEIEKEDIISLQRLAKKVDLTEIRESYVALIHNLRSAGIKVSDRRAVKVQNLIASSAIMCNRNVADLSDLWVMKYIWDTEEQIEMIAGIVDTVIDKHLNEYSHPQAAFNKAPNAEELAKEINLITQRWEDTSVSYEQKNVLKDKLRFIQSRVNWIKNQEHKKHLQTEIESLWQKMLQLI